MSPSLLFIFRCCFYFIYFIFFYILKAHFVVWGKNFELEEKVLNKQTFLLLRKLNKQTDLKGHHSFMLFCFVYMWRTLPPF